VGILLLMHACMVSYAFDFRFFFIGFSGGVGVSACFGDMVIW